MHFLNTVKIIKYIILVYKLSVVNDKQKNHVHHTLNKLVHQYVRQNYVDTSSSFDWYCLIRNGCSEQLMKNDK